MIYIRNIFQQDLRNGKQIAFPKKPSNFFFNFDYNLPDLDRNIRFTFIDIDENSVNFTHNNTVINTRLYAASSEARIDSQLKVFLQNTLNATINDLIIFSKSGRNNYEFRFISKSDADYNAYNLLLSNNHEIILNEGIIENVSDSLGFNKIYFGAPGTGKSYRITEDLKSVADDFQKRVTFHPEFDNASFVGGYKPATDVNGDVKYEFAPQIFTDIYVAACNDPDHHYYLIIEEINRGNCAEIFGELFQLLDRDPKYKVTPSNDLIGYLDKSITVNTFYNEGKMLLPDNLSILATMNTSDQSLFPMDSAFKRRWEWKYIPINYDKDISKNKSAEFKIKISDDIFIDWILFIQNINKIIRKNRHLGMDKCIGNYFVKPNDNGVIELDKFIYKVIFYLWNDVFKDEPTDSIFKDKTYEDFFPIIGKGEELVKSIFIDLKLIEEPTPKTEES